MEEFQIVSIGRLAESETNPRQHFSQRGMQELTDSVRRSGVLTPLLVRPVNGHLEIIAGARRFRAAKAAKLTELPVRVKEMGNGEALEIQVIENLQREDVHPLEEALGYQALLDRPGYDIAAIAGKVSRSESYVYQRLKLVELIEPAQKAFLQDRITAGHAVQIARLQPRDQEEAFKSCFRDRWGAQRTGKDAEACSIRDLARWIEENIHLDLHAAGFKKDDAKLLPAAGACTTCPKRTGFLPQLFPDIAKKDTCIDKACYDAKLTAFAESQVRRLSAGKEKPLLVTTEYHTQSGKRADDAPLDASRYVTLRDKKDRCPAACQAVIMAGYSNADRGKVIDVCADPECPKHHNQMRSRHDEEKYKREARQAEAKRQREREARLRILEACGAEVAGGLTQDKLLLVAVGFWVATWSEHLKTIARRRCWEMLKVKGGYGIDQDATIRKHAAGLDSRGLYELIVQLALIKQLEGAGYGDTKDRILEMAKLCGVDAKAIERKVTAEVAEREKAKAKKAAKKKKAPKAGAEA